MAPPTPPHAPRRPQVLSIHGDERVDDWYWLRDRDDPAVRRLPRGRERLRRGRARAGRRSARAHLRRDPRPHPGDRRVGAGARRRLGLLLPHRRGPAVRDPLPPARAAGGDEQVLLDENALAAGHDYFSLGGFEVSPDHRLLAYSTDLTGGERYTLRFRDLDTGADLADVVENVTYGLAWADDARTCFYVRPDDAMRPNEVWRHALGTPTERRRARVPRGRRALLPRHRPHPLGPLRADRDVVEADVGDVVRADRRARATPALDRRARARARVRGRAPLSDREPATGSSSSPTATAPATSSSSRRRSPIPAARTGSSSSPHRDDVRLDAVDAFRDHLVLSERADGLDRAPRDALRRRARRRRCPRPIPCTACGSARTPSTTRRRCATATRRWSRPSPTSTTTRAPARRRVVQGAAGARRLRPDARTRRRALWATAPDGTRVPDLGRAPARRRARRQRAGAARRLRRVRALERSRVPRVARVAARPRLRVRDRARARRRRARAAAGTKHGRLEHKANTFTDFIACAEALDRAGLHRRRRGSSRAAAARAGCSWARSPTCGPTSSPRSSPRCRSSTSSRRCSIPTSRSRSPSGRSGATRRIPTRTRA